MKKIYFITTLTIASVIVFGQTKTHSTLISQALKPMASSQKIAPNRTMSNGCDSLLNVLADDTAFTYSYNAPEWGYVGGTNSYSNVAVAEKFLSGSYTPGYQLTAAVFYFDRAEDGATPTTMTVNVWDNTGTDGSGNPGAPGSAALSSVSLAVSAMQLGLNPTLVNFPSPVSLTTDFFIGINGFQYQATQEDTVSILQNSFNHTPNHQAGAYEQWSPLNDWYAFNDPNDFGVTEMADFFIIAILCDPTLGDIQIQNPTPELIIYPNPASGNIYISTGSGKSENVSISVVDALGKVVSTYSQFTKKSGTAKVEMNGAAAGVYFVTVTTSGKSVTKKLIIE